MGPLIYPLPRAESSHASRRAVFDRTRQRHAGTLNLFAANSHGDEDGGKKEAAVTAAPHVTRRAHPNDESHETREFSWARLRRVALPEHPETARGIRPVRTALGNQQNIQVVGITDAYKDPHNMPRSRSGVRCVSRTHSSSSSLSMRDVMSRAGASGDVRPVRRSSSRVVEYTPQERFCQAVRDHAQHRRGGVTEFYVNLARGRVGRIAAEMPVDSPGEWKLLEPPRTHTLTLGSCRDQLQSLTGISVSLAEFAEMLWGARDDHAASAGDSEECMRARVVPYRDFSAAFGDNVVSNKLATLKI